jgi:hypothetical protein
VAGEILLAQQGVEEVVHPPAVELEVAAELPLAAEAALLQHPLFSTAQRASTRSSSVLWKRSSSRMASASLITPRLWNIVDSA